MTTRDVDLVLLRLDELKTDVCEVKAEVREVKDEAKNTNGRLRKLELWRAGLDAVHRAHSWVRPALVAFVSGAALACLGWILSTVGG